jgi:prolyl 4-hydroxylase
LHYEAVQFYGLHHDFIQHHADRQAGARILTISLYLNGVKAGGGTHFPQLEQTVSPRRGTALIWPSVLDQYPHKQDLRIEHAALPVEDGDKYAANAWLHQRDFQAAYDKQCL